MDIIIYCLFGFAAFLLIPFGISVFKMIGSYRNAKKNSVKGAASRGIDIVSVEVLLGVLALLAAFVLLKSDTGAVILFELASIILLLSFLWGLFIRISPYKRRRLLSFGLIMPVGVFIAGCLVFFSVYYYGAGDAGADEFTGRVWPSLMSAFHHAARLFTLDGGYIEIVGRVAEFGDYSRYYVLMMGVLYVSAGVTTFTTVFAIIKNFSAKFKYLCSACVFGINSWREVHVFSLLSDESLSLAASLTSPPEKASFWRKLSFYAKKPIIVFASASSESESASKDLIEEAKERGAILFSKDISAIRFRKSRHTYYVMGTNEGEKLRAAKDIIEYYGEYNGNMLYVFSETAQSEMFLNTLEPRRMRLVRVNAIQSLIYRSLYENGIRLFKGAARDKYGSDDRVISAVIVGLGLYGKEMLKALTWYCQMDGYRLKINAYDSDAEAVTKLRQACPELMAMSDNTVHGEAHYSINVHTFNIDSKEFYDHLSTIKDASFVFVCLGNDETNLHISKSIRELYEGLKHSKGYFRGRHYGTPDIETVIYDSMIKEMLSADWSDESFCYCDRCIDGARNFKHQPYRIHVIGDLDSFYSVDTLAADENKNALVMAGKGVHLRWSLASFVNDRYKEAILAHVKSSKNDKGPAIWLVKPRLDLTPPIMKRLLIKDIMSDNTDALGDGKKHLPEIKKALLTYTKASALDDAAWKKITESTDRIYFVYNVLSKNFDFCEVKDRQYNKIKTPKETVVLKVEGEGAPDVSAPLTRKELRAKKRKDREDRKERRKVMEDGEKDFWRYSYYYRSSLAKAIHEDLRKKLAEDPDESLLSSEVLRCAFKKSPSEDRTEEELNLICNIEHLRWNAFTRAEGYSYAGSRYDLAKQHHNLVSTDLLSDSDLRKDA